MSLMNKALSQRYKLTVQYRGTHFCGWQIQKNIEDPGVTKFLRCAKPKPSIQFAIEDSIYAFLGEYTPIYGAGRTDAGVHALSNAFHMDITRKHKKTRELIDEPYSPDIVKNAINKYLYARTPDVCITSCEMVDETFHARYSATNRSYIYRMMRGPDISGFPFEHDSRWVLKNNVNIDKMQEACEVFLGTHDFTTFRTISSDKKNPIRTISKCLITEPSKPFPFDYSPHHKIQYIDLNITAKSFLYHQVRKIVAGLVAVGSGRKTIPELREILESKDPAKCPAMAPPHGLYLIEVEYPSRDPLKEDSSFKT